MRYKYRAQDSQNQQVSGEINADSEREAMRQLRRRDLDVLELQEIAERSVAQASGKAKQRDVLVALHELTTLLESGVSLIEAVESLADSAYHPMLCESFRQAAKQLRQGTAFSVALRATALELPWYIPQLLEAGELTGKVAEALRDGVKQMEYDLKISTEMRNALIYPSILVISGVSAVLMIFIVVVPKFGNLLKGRNADDIPWLAKAVLNTGMYLNSNMELVFGTAIALVVFIMYTLRQKAFQMQLRDQLSHMPLIGVWLVEAETGRWASMMSTLLENKVPLMQALELASQGMQLPSLQARLAQVSKAVRAGTPLSQALQDNDATTATGYNLIRAGERAGELPKMLGSLARLLEESGRTRMKRLLLMIEPAAILLIGGVIGVIITGVILAITSVNQISI